MLPSISFECVINVTAVARTYIYTEKTAPENSGVDKEEDLS
jgi:hypothetical protein